MKTLKYYLLTITACVDFDKAWGLKLKGNLSCHSETSNQEINDMTRNVSFHVNSVKIKKHLFLYFMLHIHEIEF